jgi:hypothetical protein
VPHFETADRCGAGFAPRFEGNEIFHEFGHFYLHPEGLFYIMVY